MRSAILWIFISLFIIQAGAQSPGYYFPESDLSEIDESIPRPEDVLGYPIGEWHVSHDQIIRYSEVLTKASPRVEWIEYARSHEGRPLFVLRITSPDNQQKIEAVRENHLASAQGNALPHPDVPDPVVLYQGNSIHGDESSGANAAMLYAWYLAASRSEQIEKALQSTVILLDPCFNPDGLHRFSTWVNSNTGTVARNCDPADREFHQPWPGGRTNHYWFDLNRDWLLLQHPESRGRIELFNQWLPHVLTDHHEMGSDATYFFQPGIPSRTHPITLDRNQELTGRIAEFHASSLDEIGSLYYTEESFDDYYYGKGSTYPDVRGCIGILFEQASSRGHRQSTDRGLLTFPFTIRNQLATFRSTLEAGTELTEELRDYQRHFFSTERTAADKHSVHAYLIRQCEDPVRWSSFVDLLHRHGIRPSYLNRDVTTEGRLFRNGKDVIVPMDAGNFFLKRALFETMETFPDSLFYDVSTWTLPLAYHLKYAAYKGGNPARISGQQISSGSWRDISTFVHSAYGYIIPWDHFNAANAAAALLRKGYKLTVATRPLRVIVSDGVRQFDRGALFVSAVQKNPEKLDEALQGLHLQYDLPVYPVRSGLTEAGIDLGSPSMELLEDPKTLLLAGPGIRAYDAGEIWHLFETRLHMPVTKAAPDRIHRIDLDHYNRVAIPHAYRVALNEKAVIALTEWVRDGGVLIVERGAVSWAASHGLAGGISNDMQDKPSPPPETAEIEMKPYSGISRDRGSQRIGGAIFAAKMDTTHPLAYGYSNDEISLFKRGTLSIGQSENPYAQPVQYKKHPLQSGYAPEETVSELGGTAAVRVFRLGRGRIICFADNTHFRAYFRGTERLFVNAIFFGHIIDGRTAETVSGK